jgi:tetratricopeptide (TPR) repeat protein
VQASLTIEQRVQEGLAAQNRGDFAAAEALYLQILAIQSDHFDALHLLGVIRIHQGRNFDALELIGTALKKQPNDALALSNMEWCSARSAAPRKRWTATTRRSRCGRISPRR